MGENKENNKQIVNSWNMEKIKIFFQELFYVLTGALLIFSVMEFFWERIVLVYINLSWVLILWMINVIVLLLLTLKNNENK